MRVVHPLNPWHLGCGMCFSNHKSCVIALMPCRFVRLFLSTTSWVIVLVRVCLLYGLICIIVCLSWFWECVLYSFYDVRKRRRRRCREALFQVPVTPKPGTQRVARQAILMLAVILLIIIYHACFYLWSFTKNLIIKLFSMWLLLLENYRDYYYASSWYLVIPSP